MAAGEPDPFRDTFLAYIAAESIAAATRLHVFDSLAAEPATAAELAGRLGVDPFGTDALLTALGALGYAERSAGGRWRPAPVAARLLVRDSPESIAHFVESSQDMHREALATLGDTLRGGSGRAWHASPSEHPMWEPYIRGLFELSRGEHAENAALVQLEHPRTLLDVAGGHGGFAMAMCRRHGGLRATVLDLPGSVAVGRRIVRAEGFADRIDFRAGDALRDDLGDGWDVISVFNLIHHLQPEQNLELCRRARAAGGCLVIGDTERPEPGSTASEVGAVTGVVHYALSRGRTYTRAEIEGWLREAGFDAIETHRHPGSPWRIVTIGRR
jgi:SAM-dependent methyltransferase